MSVGLVAQQDIVRTWQQGGPSRYALGPLAWGYRLGVGLRRLAFRAGLLRQHRVSVPVLSLGNLTVGGTGKTPAALWLAEWLREQGERPAIVTRGYGGHLRGRVVTVGRDGKALYDAREIGDEGVLLAERFAGPVVCGADRVAAAKMAIDQHGATVLILDDGFQHWRLARDLDVLLVDGRMGFGNGALLPAGPLREPLSALRRADAIVITKAKAGSRVAETLVRFAPGVPTFSAELKPRSLMVSEDGELLARPLGDLVGRKVVTVSAIAQPQSFYELLGQLEVRPVEVLEFPDHHQYTQADWQRITQAAHRAELVVCTEKDIVKLRRFPFARGGLAALRVDFALRERDEERFTELLKGRLEQSLRLRTAGEDARSVGQ
ncbi:MAG TPA: tetraacyldisaccharide 4'-kinase [Candidatus Binatia bacterium]